MNVSLGEEGWKLIPNETIRSRVQELAKEAAAEDALLCFGIFKLGHMRRPLVTGYLRTEGFEIMSEAWTEVIHDQLTKMIIDIVDEEKNTEEFEEVASILQMSVDDFIQHSFQMLWKTEERLPLSERIIPQDHRKTMSEIPDKFRPLVQQLIDAAYTRVYSIFIALRPKESIGGCLVMVGIPDEAMKTLLDAWYVAARTAEDVMRSLAAKPAN